MCLQLVWVCTMHCLCECIHVCILLVCITQYKLWWYIHVLIHAHFWCTLSMVGNTSNGADLAHSSEPWIHLSCLRLWLTKYNLVVLVYSCSPLKAEWWINRTLLTTSASSVDANFSGCGSVFVDVLQLFLFWYCLVFKKIIRYVCVRDCNMCGA